VAVRIWRWKGFAPIVHISKEISMFALILVTGLHAFAGVAVAFAAGVAAGYAFRGKENAALKAAGAAVGQAAASASSTISAEVKKL
jgi:hypothetical protein